MIEIVDFMTRDVLHTASDIETVKYWLKNNPYTIVVLDCDTVYVSMVW
jgi:hypothetical protein